MSTISLPERFDFSFHKQFTDSYTEALANSGGGKVITLDFGLVMYLDSAALGMLVLANKRAKEKSCKLEIINAKGAAKDVLNIANFDRLITIR